jgi:hypothetical protein
MRTDELPPHYLDQPAPDPAAIAQPSEDAGSRDNPLIRNMPACTAYDVDVEALARLGDRVVIAVGVESADAWHLLQAMDCDATQGFFFSRPLPAPLLEPLLRQHCPSEALAIHH